MEVVVVWCTLFLLLKLLLRQLRETAVVTATMSNPEVTTVSPPCPMCNDKKGMGAPPEPKAQVGGET